MTVKEMIKKLINFLKNMLIEVYDFAKFLDTEKERELLIQASQKMSETSFEKIWNNEEYSTYDKL